MHLVALLVAAGVVASTMGERGYAGWLSGTAPRELGARDGQLRPCPDKPNCVCSQTGGVHHVEPLAFDGSADTALARLKQVLLATARIRMVEEATGYLRVEAYSRLFGFVDDVEFLLDRERRVVHVRSASRLGYSDFGVNRRRIEAIRKRFETRTDPGY